MDENVLEGSIRQRLVLDILRNELHDREVRPLPLAAKKVEAKIDHLVIYIRGIGRPAGLQPMQVILCSSYETSTFAKGLKLRPGGNLTEQTMCFCQIFLKDEWAKKLQTDDWGEECEAHRKKFDKDADLLRVPFDEEDRIQRHDNLTFSGRPSEIVLLFLFHATKQSTP
ncbi:uncharacterized protein N7484_000042 [Penicillium longicatenatum]|uniref:uncharacterized protein n=1 Tax=Penicillium longicatenatum TaxID=1561947 RepID=UPI002547CD96|nr:uncharacterized protein N7484_000042 [Penicillium longicatenatum]KAJ5660670.1 hypothetical protein N7484_000042 [Penicillium longicatenatum]